jgi:two-component system, chemotaxis family, chemotaxis protein CheY
MKILVVDDSNFARKIMISNLRLLGYTDFTEAVNGQEAIYQYCKIKPDLVFMDIVMPIMDGVTALEKITKEFPMAKIVISSSMGQMEYIKKAIMAGAREFIVKPVEFQRLKEVVSKIIINK